MEQIVLENGIKLIYEKRGGNLTSFCIGFNAGALVEEKEELGLAHVVEHMLFKGTIKRSEYEINKLIDNTFGFSNAMTNYPYSIYYGTLLSKDFEKGLEIYSDIIINPMLSKEGFKEEKSIIKEELVEWKDDINQSIEDELLYNGFKNRRIKDLIIGTEESLNNITIENVKKFYNKYFTPLNSVISVVTSIELKDVLHIVNKYFKEFKREYTKPRDILYENINSGKYVREKTGIKGAKIKFCFDISNLSFKEGEILRLLNLCLAEGTASILYDRLRTREGLIYDVLGEIRNEVGIELYFITLSTSIANIDRCIKIVKESIEQLKNNINMFNKETIYNLKNILELKDEIKYEKSIERCKKITIDSIMNKPLVNYLEKVEEEEVLKVVDKCLKNPIIQIFIPKE